MNPRTVILAFLSERSPAAYSEFVIETRCNGSGLFDAPIASINSELSYLATERMGNLVKCDINPVTKEAVWYATDKGCERWVLDGRMHVK